MDCREAQQLLLGADNAAALPAENAALAAHARTCPDCQRLLARLERLTGAAANLPPGPPSAPPPAFLAQLAMLGADDGFDAPAPIGKIMPAAAPAGGRRYGPGRAVAAAIILVIGLTALTLCLRSSPARADNLLTELSAWNLELAQSRDPAQRHALYQRHAQEMKQRVAAAALSPEDRAVAQAMLDSAAQQAAEDNPLDHAARFSQIADQVRRLEAGATPERRATLEHLRADLSQGVRTHLQSVNPATLSPADRERFQALQQHENPQPGPGAALPRPTAQSPAPAVAWSPLETQAVIARSTASLPRLSAPTAVSGDTRLTLALAPPPKPPVDMGAPSPANSRAAPSIPAPPRNPATEAKSIDDDDANPSALPPASLTFAPPQTDDTTDFDSSAGAARKAVRPPATATLANPAVVHRVPPPATVAPPVITKPTAQPAAFEKEITVLSDQADLSDLLPEAGSAGTSAYPDAAEFPAIAGLLGHGGGADTDARTLDADDLNALPPPPLPPGGKTSALTDAGVLGASLPGAAASSMCLENTPADLHAFTNFTVLGTPATTIAPEPATAILLLLGGVILLRRRRT